MTGSERKSFVGGNWKMNPDLSGAESLIEGVVGEVGPISDSGPDVFVFPSFVHLDRVAAAARSSGGSVRVGAQDLYHEASGAFTGEVSVGMLVDLGVQAALVGHSERRHVIGEDDRVVNQKLTAALAGGLIGVLCVGETLEQRESGQTDEVNERQTRLGLAGVSADDMKMVIIAYEPVWAIGTGKTATPEDAQAAHAKIRGVVADLYGESVAAGIRIIYGGSMKPGNAEGLMAMADIDGGLIGGASLKADDFGAICRAAGGSPV